MLKESAALAEVKNQVDDGFVLKPLMQPANVLVFQTLHETSFLLQVDASNKLCLFLGCAFDGHSPATFFATRLMHLARRT
jgi:hypothetical protein